MDQNELPADNHESVKGALLFALGFIAVTAAAVLAARHALPIDLSQHLDLNLPSILPSHNPDIG